MSVWFWVFIITAIVGWLLLLDSWKREADLYRLWQETRDAWKATIDELADAERYNAKLARHMAAMQRELDAHVFPGDEWKN